MALACMLSEFTGSPKLDGPVGAVAAEPEEGLESSEDDEEEELSDESLPEPSKWAAARGSAGLPSTSSTPLA